MSKVRIACAEYLNAISFQYGISESKLIDAELLLLPPAECAEKLASQQVDIALVPLATLPSLGDDVEVVTSHCVGATGAVRTVVLLSDESLDNIERVWLDPDSRTSIKLLAHLCEHHFHISPRWHLLSDMTRVEHPSPGDAFLLIGDKVFDHEGIFEYSIDLAEEWLRHSSKPFAFAVWAARRDLDVEALEAVEEALTWGVEHTFEALQALRPDVEIEEGYTYLTQNIDTILDSAKREAMELFLASTSRIELTRAE